MVLAVARHAQTDPDMAAMFCLGFSSAVIARSVVIRDVAGGTDVPALWVVVIAESGTGKTRTFNPLIAPIRDLERAAAGQQVTPDAPSQAGPAGSPWYERLDSLEAVPATAHAAPWATAAHVGDLLRVAQEAAFPGVPVRFIETNTTPEALVDSIACQAFGLLQASSEAEMLSRVNVGNAVEALAHLNQMWEGEDVRRSRVVRGAVIARRAVLAVVVSPQPRAFEQLRSGQLGRLIEGTGFLARCLFCVPTSTVGTRVAQVDPIPIAVRQRYAENLRAMLAVMLPRGPQPNVLTLSDEATRLAQAFYAEIEPRLGTTGDLYAVGQWASRVRQSATRIAAVLHVADLARERQEGLSDPISASAMERGIAIAHWMLTQGRQVWSEPGRAGLTGATEAAVVAQVRLMRSDFTAREIYRAMGLSSGDTVTPVLDALVARGVLTMYPDGRTTRYRLVDS
jgi:hypothetical protein